MEYIIMAVAIEPRNISAPKVQEVLTKHGCIIKVRLGLHDVLDNECSKRGLVLLQLSGKKEEIETLRKDLESIDGVKVNIMTV
ncbi:hypothetical protein RBU49_16755 [Clostridium sp. MB40-C1]|uniref:hypothetical protein n=1 Tax=Clostridium sp. MB40-C1 TaxID=3070996 RepID=UPI0027DFD67B|nr:hypothetical protein [Clostridium sp. MB40-C1]WMJ80433.1 hypothetical protein RBU49_16755 [Clostridium sp. MB40-C1]